VVLGTTDTPTNDFVLEPKALEKEVDFILETSGRYLTRQPRREDVLSVFAGLRPLAAPTKNATGKKTKEISRSHKIVCSQSGLVTITGGKWTTYRVMAEDAVNKSIHLSGLPKKKCITRNLRIHGYMENVDRSNFSYVYGSEYEKILNIEKNQPEYAGLLHPGLNFTLAEVVWSIREEMSMTVDDVLSRRLRATFLDARAAIDSAPKVASIMAKEMGKDAEWEKDQINYFISIAKNYLLTPL